MDNGASTPEAAAIDMVVGVQHRDAKLRDGYLLHVFNLLLAATAFVAVMIERGLPVWTYLFLFLIVVALPTISFRLRASSSRNINRLNVLDVLGEHFFAGIATACLLAFNALPSLLVVGFLGAMSVAIGGLPLLIAGVVVHGLGIAVGVMLAGPQWAPQTSMFVLLGCVPLLVLHPLLGARITGNAMRTARRRQTLLECQSRLDGLSGLYNRTFWESLVRRVDANCRKGQGTATLIMADLDFFKHINDMHGHDAGDQVIRGFSTLLRDQLRDTDICGRYGGEEFGILMPRTTATDACAVIERLRAVMRDRPLLPNARVTASFGLAEWTPEIRDHQTWMRLVDQMLYRAKHLGRDRLAVLGEIGQVSDEIAADRQRSILPVQAVRSDPPALRDPAALPALMSGLQYLEQPFALFDSSDRLAYGSPKFVDLFHVQDGRPTFTEIIRYCHRHGVGPSIETDDIEAWLRRAKAKRQSQTRRGFPVNMADGRWLWVSEVLYDDGWLMLSMTDVTSAYVAKQKEQGSAEFVG